MSAIATTYVRIHLTRFLAAHRIDQAVVDWIADVADDRGVARCTQAQIAYGVHAHIKTIEKSFSRLKSPESGPVVYRLTGRRWGIVGVATHDESTCGELECQAKAAAGKNASEAKRRKAADRARRYRERKAAERR